MQINVAGAAVWKCNKFVFLAERSRKECSRLLETRMSYYFSKTLEMPFVQAIQHATDALGSKGFGVLTTIDVRAMRRRLGLSQSEFAAKFGFQPATLKNWEQGQTRPDGPARVLLAVIARHPEAVLQPFDQAEEDARRPDDRPRADDGQQGVDPADAEVADVVLERDHRVRPPS